YGRPGDHSRFFGPCRVDSFDRCFPSKADSRRRCHRAGEIEPFRVCRQRGRDGLLSSSRLYKKPYALDRVTAGSNGGTAAAVSANFGAVGLGSDTENSIRGPSSHTSLVGIRCTMGLTSRAGIVPLDLDRDIGGPMTRTVADAVAVFDVIAGPDPDDPITEASKDKMPPQGYLKASATDGLTGIR